MVPVAGIEPAWIIHPRDFESLASTNSTTRALKDYRLIKRGNKHRKEEKYHTFIEVWPKSVIVEKFQKSKEKVS